MPDRTQLQEQAWLALSQILHNEAAPADVRLRAARLILRKTDLPEVPPTPFERHIARNDRLCAQIIPHQALHQLK